MKKTKIIKLTSKTRKHKRNSKASHMESSTKVDHSLQKLHN